MWEIMGWSRKIVPAKLDEVSKFSLAKGAKTYCRSSILLDARPFQIAYPMVRTQGFGRTLLIRTDLAPTVSASAMGTPISASLT